MRIERVTIGAFGRFEAFDSGADALGALTVVTGPNESGKSTFFTFLTTLLYGFSPVALEKHPYTPWSGASMEGEARLRLDNGTSLALRRRLLGSPWGRLEVEGAETDLRNRPLPFVEHVPRSVFTQVYALTLAELGHLEGATWSTIQDRMIASLLSDDVRPAREVAETLVGEAGALWRPNRRGHQSSRALAETLRDLQQQRREASERDARLRDLDRRLGERGEALAGLRAERADALTRLERLERLLPDAHRLARLDELAVRPRTSTAELPLDPAGELARLRREADEQAEEEVQAGARAERLEARRDELRTRARPVMDAEERLDRLRVTALPALAADGERATVERERARLESTPADAPAPAALSDPVRPAQAAAALALAGLVCLVWAGLGGGLPAYGVAFLLLGGAATLALRAVGAVRTAADARLQHTLARTRAEEHTAALERLRAREGELRARVEEAEADAQALAADLGVFEGAGLARTLEGLEQLRSRAREWSAEARSLDEALEALRTERTRLQERAQRSAGAARALHERLARLGDGDPDAGVQRFVRSQAQDAESRRLLDEIRERHGSVERLRHAIEEHVREVGPVEDAALARARAEQQERAERIEDLRGEVAGLEKDIAHLRTGPSVADVDGEIESVRVERARQERERDRKMLLAGILAEADRRFRERHQPDVVRRGAQYVARITSGRYHTLATGDRPGEPMLYVKHNGGPGIDVTGPLSTGTKEQIYLALRLAVVDHLDHGRERLPLFLDESFVNWDAERRDQGLRLLKELSRRRQVFVFTCHRDLADRLQTLGARVLRLGDGEQVELW
ncbi:MAG: AAA family ATPase [Gemmatimonadota bacterium]